MFDFSIVVVTLTVIEHRSTWGIMFRTGDYRQFVTDW
jgi:hypothetical protein